MQTTHREFFEQRLLQAKAGMADAQLDVAASYMLGYGVLVNSKESFRWAKDAAEQGNIKAQLLLGYLYTFGIGTISSKSKAEMWFKKASFHIRENRQVQNALIKFGYLRKIQEDDTGELYVYGGQGLEAAAWVCVTDNVPCADGTVRQYFISVPPHITTAREAMRWTFAGVQAQSA